MRPNGSTYSTSPVRSTSPPVVGSVGPRRNGCALSSTDPRLACRHPRLRSQRSARHPRRQPARRSVLCTAVRRPGPSRQLGAVRVPQPGGEGLLPRLGHHRRRRRRNPPVGSRSRPLRLAAVRPHRRAVHSQRRVPGPLGCTQREAPPHRREALPPPRGGRTDPRLRIARATGDPGQKLLVYSAQPASHSHEALNLLASWASTPAATVDESVDEH